MILERRQVMGGDNKSLLIKNYLLNRIRSGELQPNDCIESEVELADKFNVSRMTARSAIEELSTRGYFYRRRGKGTFVREPSSSTDRTFHSFSEALALKGQSARNQVVTYFHAGPNSEVIAHLQIRKSEEILYIQRLRIVDELPYAYEDSAYVSSIFGVCTEEILAGSIYEHLESQRHVKIVLSNQEIESVSADEWLSKWLDVPVGSPLLKITTVAIMRNGIAFEYTKTYYRSDRFKMSQTTYR
jgi:GntR family transcriptional regulator